MVKRKTERYVNFMVCKKEIDRQFDNDYNN